MAIPILFTQNTVVDLRSASICTKSRFWSFIVVVPPQSHETIFAKTLITLFSRLTFTCLPFPTHSAIFFPFTHIMQRETQFSTVYLFK